MTPRGPRIARALLSLLIPADERTAVLRDIDEEFAEHVIPARGARRARVWYWRQVIGSIRPALAMRRRRSGLIEGSVRDASFAFRALRRRPGLSAVAIATFALGIGANTAIFSVVDAIVLRPLPFPDPDRLVRIWSANPKGIPRNAMSPADYFDLAEQATGPAGLAAVAAFTAGDSVTLREGEASRIVASSVSTNFFQTLGVLPATGRPMLPSDGAEGMAVAIVSDTFSRTHFNGQAVGRQMSIEGRSVTVIGVMPAPFAFPSPSIDVWLPMRDSERSLTRAAHYLEVLGRLQPGATRDSATDALRTVAARLATAYPDTNRGWSVTVDQLQASIVGSVRRPLLVLLAAVGCVLLIACANVAGLLLADGHDRSRELSLRAALGASPARLLRQQLLEGLALSGAGAVAAVVLAKFGLALLQQVEGLALPRGESIVIDLRVLVVTGTVAVLTGVLAGVAPAIRAARIDPEEALKGSRVSGDSVSARRVRSVLVVGQLALTLGLAVGAGLLVRSFVRLTNVDAGFNPDNVLLAQVNLAMNRYEPERWASYVARSEEQLSGIPGVIVAGAAAPLPLTGQDGLMRFGVRIDGVAPSEGRTDRAYLRRATPGYFRAMGIPALSGRSFARGDDARATPVAIVDRTFAEVYFPNIDPLGRRIQMSNERVPRTVVGVVGAVRQTRLESAGEPHVYVPQAQNPSPAMTFVVRTASNPAALAGTVRERLRSVDPAQPVYNVRTGDTLVAASAVSRKFNASVPGALRSTRRIAHPGRRVRRDGQLGRRVEEGVRRETGTRGRTPRGPRDGRPAWVAAHCGRGYRRHPAGGDCVEGCSRAVVRSRCGGRGHLHQCHSDPHHRRVCRKLSTRASRDRGESSGLAPRGLIRSLAARAPCERGRH